MIALLGENCSDEYVWQLMQSPRNLIIFSPELINFFQSGITLPSIKCSENRLGSTVPFCLFDRVLNVISIKDIDDNGCKLKTRDLIFTKSSAISPKVLNLFAFIDCNKDMPSLIRVVLEISKNGQCLYYRNVLFQLMYKICLTGFAHCAIVEKQ